MRRLPSGRLPAPLHDASGHPDGVLFRIVKVGTAEVVGQGYESDMPAAAIPTVATCRLDGRVRRDPLYAGGGLLLVHYPGPSLKSTRAERSSTGAGLSVRAVDVIERGKKATHSRVIDTVMLHLRLPAGFHEALVIPDGSSPHGAARASGDTTRTHASTGLGRRLFAAPRHLRRPGTASDRLDG